MNSDLAKQAVATETTVHCDDDCERAQELIRYLRRKGVALWSEQGRLHYKSPPGSLTQADIEQIRALKEPIIDSLTLCDDNSAAQSHIPCGSQLKSAPLSFPQLSHWNWYELDRRPGARFVASATHIHGALDLSALHRSLSEVVRHHDALRTSIVIREGSPIQEISQEYRCELDADDLEALSDDEWRSEVERLIEDEMFKPIDVTKDSLLAVRLLRHRDDEHVLIIASDHLIADGFSMNILMRDLFTAYVQIARGRAVSLPGIGVTYAEYAGWQRSAARSWVEKSSAYWNEHLLTCPPLRLPEDQSRGSETGLGLVPIVIGKDLRNRLSEWCRKHKTTLVMGVLTAYAALLLRWCNASEGVLQYQTNGRFSPELQNTIGFFAFRLYLRISLQPADTFLDLLERTTKEYCLAYEHADYSYLQAQVPRPDFTVNPCFNWLAVENAGDDVEAQLAQLGIQCSRIPFERRHIPGIEGDSATMMGLIDNHEEVRGVVQFSPSQVSFTTMERFARNFDVHVRALLERPGQRVRGIELL